MRFFAAGLTLCSVVAVAAAQSLPAELQSLLALYRSARYAEALPLARALAAKAEASLPVQDPNLGMILNFVGGLETKLGQYPAALATLTRALAVREQGLGPDHADVAQSLNNLAALRMRMGEYRPAAPLLERALRIRIARYGTTHPAVADALNSLAAVAGELGDLPRARRLLEASLFIYEVTHGKESPLLAIPLRNLGAILRRLGDFEGARSHLEHALKLRSAQRGAEHPDVAAALDSLGSLLALLGDHAEGRRHLERAVAIYEARLGALHPKLAAPLSNLAGILRELGDYEGERQRYERAYAIAEKSLGPDHPTTAMVRYNLGELAAFLGDDAKARPLLEAALASLARRLAPHDPVRTRAENELAGLLERAGERQAAWSLFERARAGVSRQRTIVNEGPLPEAAKLAYARESLRETDLFVEAALLRHDGAARAAVVEAVLERQGAVLAAAGSADARDPPEVRRLRKLLRAVHGRMARALTRGKKGNEVAADLEALARERDLLEGELVAARRRAGSAPHDAPPTLARLCDALPEGHLLVLYFVLGETRRARGKPAVAPRLFAATVSHGCAVKIHPLGELAPVERRIERFRAALRSQTDLARVRKLGARLYRALVAPWAGDATGARAVLVSTEAALAFLPFGALVDAEGRWLLDTLPIVLVDGGRDVLRLRTLAEVGSGALLYGNPDFDLVPAPGAKLAGATRGSAPCGLGAMRFARLAGAEAEVRRIAALFDAAKLPVRVREGADAREQTLKAEVGGHRYLAFATHGYLAPASCTSDREAARRNPLLLSGIVLAGANQPVADAEGNDGWLTAAEIATLDLRRTELVVLSACETGLGQLQASEGVLGLRRAISQAGARGLVMSLWPVADEATSELMSSFFQRVLACAADIKCTKWQALRAAQQALRAKFPHPFHWAPFVYAGEWGR